MGMIRSDSALKLYKRPLTRTGKSKDSLHELDQILLKLVRFSTTMTCYDNSTVNLIVTSEIESKQWDEE